MKYFIASKWTNMKSVQYLTENLLTLGHEVFSFVPDKRNFVPEENLNKQVGAFEPGDDWPKRVELKKILDKGMVGIAESDIVILLFPAGSSSHIEAGIGYGLNKKLILIGPVNKVEPYYLIFDEWYKSIDQYLSGLKKTTD